MAEEDSTATYSVYRYMQGDQPVLYCGADSRQQQQRQQRHQRQQQRQQQLFLAFMIFR